VEQRNGSLTKGYWRNTRAPQDLRRIASSGCRGWSTSRGLMMTTSGPKIFAVTKQFIVYHRRSPTQPSGADLRPLVFARTQAAFPAQPNGMGATKATQQHGGSAGWSNVRGLLMLNGNKSDNIRRHREQSRPFRLLANPLEQDISGHAQTDVIEKRVRFPSPAANQVPDLIRVISGFEK